MAYSTFCQTQNDQLKEPMFFGQSVNVARYDQQKHDIFERLIEKQLSFFWRPEEVDVSHDRIDYQALPPHEQHIFISNLKYQTLLDSIQGRSPNVALLPLVSIPELETWIETWAFSETIHSRSYTHIIRNIVNNPGQVFDDIITNEQILKRAGSISHYYDDLIDEDQGRSGAAHFLERHLGDDSANPEALAERRELQSRIAHAITQLPEREQTVLALYYEHELNLKEIGAVLEVSESRVSQILSSAIARIRAQLLGQSAAAGKRRGRPRKQAAKDDPGASG